MMNRCLHLQANTHVIVLVSFSHAGGGEDEEEEKNRLMKSLETAKKQMENFNILNVFGGDKGKKEGDDGKKEDKKNIFGNLFNKGKKEEAKK